MDSISVLLGHVQNVIKLSLHPLHATQASKMSWSAHIQASAPRTNLGQLISLQKVFWGSDDRSGGGQESGAGGPRSSVQHSSEWPARLLVQILPWLKDCPCQLL